VTVRLMSDGELSRLEVLRDLDWKRLTDRSPLGAYPHLAQAALCKIELSYAASRRVGSRHRHEAWNTAIRRHRSPKKLTDRRVAAATDVPITTAPELGLCSKVSALSGCFGEKDIG